MKVIVTGATGFVGAQVLQQCLRDKRITQILVLSRRDIAPEYKLSGKVSVIIQDDFSHFSDQILERLSAAESCIWCIGGKVEDFPDIETAKKVQVHYTLAAANAFASRLLAKAPAGTFRFVFCSGAHAVRDENAHLWFQQETRRLKGEAEDGLIGISNAHQGFEAYVLRPGGILPQSANGFLITLGMLFPSVKVDRLAQIMVEIAVKGHNVQTLENEAILNMS